MRVQPRDPRRYVHVALHEFVGRDLQWGPLRLRPTVPRPHQIAQNAREARPPPQRSPRRCRSQRHDCAAAGADSPRTYIPILGISTRPDQVNAEQNLIRRLQTLLHLPIALHARVAGRHACPPAQTRGHHRLHRLRRLPQKGRPSHAELLFRKPNPSHLHRHRCRRPPREPAGVRGGDDPESDPKPRRNSH